MTEYGGTNGVGAVFKVTTNGALTTLASFNYYVTGGHPFGRLALGADGKFYGTTFQGGKFDNGTVFAVTTNGTLTSLFSFSGTDGAFPYAGLTPSANGKFYGATFYGGAENNGTIFSITTNGTLATVSSFNEFITGGFPFTGLTLGKDGNFYGASFYGGTNSDGAVFKMTTNGDLTAIFSFNFTNGSNPNCELIQGTDGLLYGTTANGGANGFGTVFKMSTNGALTTLFSFNSTNGSTPIGALAPGGGNTFYGTTYQGGLFGDGTMFTISSAGVMSNLFSFDGPNGSGPGGLIQGRDGRFYGTTAFGGQGFDGAVFSGEGTIIRFGPKVAASFSGLSLSQLTTYGDNSITLSGTVGGPQGAYPTPGELISVTNDGSTQTTPINDDTGDFSLNYDPQTIPVSGSAYTITYSYGGDEALGPANNTNTSLTVLAAPLTVTATDESKTYGQALAMGPGDTNFTSSGLQNGEIIESVTLASDGAAALAPVSFFPYLITASAAVGGNGLEASNYEITYDTGLLTVNPPPLTITGTNRYNGSDVVSASHLSIVTNYDGSNLTLSGSVTLASAAAGVEPIASFAGLSLRGSAAGNYTLVEQVDQVIIQARALTITANDLRIVRPTARR